MQKSVHVVLVVLRGTFTVHLRVVVKEIWVYFVQKPLLLRDGLLHQHKSGGADPVYESTSWPLVSEGQMKKLENLEKRSEAIDKPMFVLFCDAALTIS